jgi:hypothetical protein
VYTPLETRVRHGGVARPMANLAAINDTDQFEPTNGKL